MIGAALFSSARGDWRTPEEILARVRHVGPILLDPCASKKRAHQFAAYNYDNAKRPGRNGLRETWTMNADGRVGVDPRPGIVYVNPPYGRGILDWMRCAANPVNRSPVIALVPARTDTVWWQEYVAAYANRIAFWCGRLTFKGARWSAPFPSALVLYTHDKEVSARFREAFESVAWIVSNVHRTGVPIVVSELDRRLAP
jgi:site-specific DNA-methyltransferase (adenine-specific)